MNLQARHDLAIVEQDIGKKLISGLNRRLKIRTFNRLGITAILK